jgi:hypothetical protein
LTRLAVVLRPDARILDQYIDLPAYRGIRDGLCARPHTVEIFEVERGQSAA